MAHEKNIHAILNFCHLTGFRQFLVRWEPRRELLPVRDSQSIHGVEHGARGCVACWRSVRRKYYYGLCCGCEMPCWGWLYPFRKILYGCPTKQNTNMVEFGLLPFATRVAFSCRTSLVLRSLVFGLWSWSLVLVFGLVFAPRPPFTPLALELCSLLQRQRQRQRQTEI